MIMGPFLENFFNHIQTEYLHLNSGDFLGVEIAGNVEEENQESQESRRQEDLNAAVSITEQLRKKNVLSKKYEQPFSLYIPFAKWDTFHVDDILTIVEKMAQSRRVFDLTQPFDIAISVVRSSMA